MKGLLIIVVAIFALNVVNSQDFPRGHKSDYQLSSENNKQTPENHYR